MWDFSELMFDECHGVAEDVESRFIKMRPTGIDIKATILEA